MRLLALALAAIGAAAAWFVVELWLLVRDDDEESDDEPTDEELDRLAYDVPHGMPTHHYSLLV